MVYEVTKVQQYYSKSGKLKKNPMRVSFKTRKEADYHATFFPNLDTKITKKGKLVYGKTGLYKV